MSHQLLEKPVRKSKKAVLLEVDEVSGLQFEAIFVEGYEQVIKVTHPKAKLSAIIAIHNSSLGPSLGGIRIHPYASFQAALEDVLRLSKGMTYKSAIAEVGFGGSKAVIIADPKTEKTPELLLAFGSAVEYLGGRYICAEDAGCTVQDVQIIRQKTKYVVGLSNANSSGDPSRFTSWGIFRGIQATAKKIFGSDSLEGKKIAIQGLGSVGMKLAETLFWAGAELIVSDVDQAKMEEAANVYRCKTVAPGEILRVKCDILAPCAMGGIINDQTIPQFQALSIAGGANNQLLKEIHANQLKERGILYAPDFVINAGGLLNVAAELDEQGYCPRSARCKTHSIYDTLLAIYDIAEKNGESTHHAAFALADHRIKYGIGKRLAPPTFHHVAE